jgi:hypothetical protein
MKENAGEQTQVEFKEIRTAFDFWEAGEEMQAKFKKIHTASDFWEAVEKDSNMVLESDITLFRTPRDLRHYSATIIGFGKKIIVEDGITLFQCFSGIIENVWFKVIPKRTDEYAFFSRLCKRTGEINDSEIYAYSGTLEEVNNIYCFGSIEDKFLINDNKFYNGIQIAINKNRTISLEGNKRIGKKGGEMKWDDFHKENFFKNTQACFRLIPKTAQYEEFSIEEMLKEKKTIDVFSVLDYMKNPVWDTLYKNMREMFLHGSRKNILRPPDYIGGGKYEIFWVHEGDELLEFIPNEEIEYNDTKYRVIGISSYEDCLDCGFDEEDPKWKVVLQPLNEGSLYWYTSEGVFRYSEHWGKVKDSQWDLDSHETKTLAEMIKKIQQGDFVDKEEYITLSKNFYDFNKRKGEKVKMLGFCAWENFEQNK